MSANYTNRRVSQRPETTIAGGTSASRHSALVLITTASLLPSLAFHTSRWPNGWNGVAAWPEQITYWDAYDGTAIRVIEGGDEEMNTLDVEPSGEAFVSGGDDGLVKVRYILR